MLEQALSTRGTIVFAAVLAGGAGGALSNPALYHATYEAIAGWGVSPPRLVALLCFLPLLAAGSAAGFGYDFLTGQGVFAPAARPACDGNGGSRGL